jgi:ABC-type glycerol-3-phosphate transport system permease component
MVGYGFAKHKFPGHEVLFGVLLATMIIPLGVIMLPLYLLMRDLHWIDTYQALIVPSAVGALGVFFMRQYISTIPDELLDAARLDGAGEVNLFRRVILPMSLPALASLGVIVFVNQWNNFVWPLVILQSPEKFTLPLILSSGSLAGSNYMAVAVVSLIPMAALFLIFQGRFVEGVTTGAMSG